MRERIDVLETTAMQNKLAALAAEGPKPSNTKNLKEVIAEGSSNLKLGKHIIPLTQMKSRVEGCEAGIEAFAGQLDGEHGRKKKTEIYKIRGPFTPGFPCS